MAKKKNQYAVEDFLSEADRLLKDVESLDDFVRDIPSESAEALNAGIRKESLEAIDEVTDQQWGGYVEITLSDKQMYAIANFFPPSQGMEPLTPDGVAEVLNHKQIVEGVDWDTINKAVFKCNTEFEPVTNVFIARGREPQDEIPEHIEIEKKHLERDDDSNTNKGRIDFRAQSPFVLVKEGAPLAYAVPMKPGVEGTTVLGKSIPYNRAKVATLKPGKNVNRKNETFVAGCDGKFERDEKEFWISEVLEITNNIDYRTGNIDFPGDVIIYGEVRDGFKVHAGGSIYCARTMDASEVVCKGDVFVRQGIIGRKDGVLKAEGAIEAKFIENCYVETQGPISIEVGIMNSSVHTLDRIHLGHRGIITGGEVYAQDGVATTQLGSQAGTKTAVHCGIDFQVEAKLEWIRDRNIQLAIKLNRVREEIRRSSSENPALSGLRDKLLMAIRKMNDAATNLVGHLDKNEEVDILVRGNVFPGVYIEICHCSYIVSRQLSSVRFTLDKANGKVTAGPIPRAANSVRHRAGS